MKKIVKAKCEACEFKGYSPELCKVHHKKLVNEKPAPGCPAKPGTLGRVGKSAAVGAGMGIASAIGGMAFLPAGMLKSVLGPYILFKMGVGTCGAGASYGLFNRKKNGITPRAPRRQGINPFSSRHPGTSNGKRSGPTRSLPGETKPCDQNIHKTERRDHGREF